MGQCHVANWSSLSLPFLSLLQPPRCVFFSKSNAALPPSSSSLSRATSLSLLPASFLSLSLSKSFFLTPHQTHSLSLINGGDSPRSYTHWTTSLRGNRSGGPYLPSHQIVAIGSDGRCLGGHKGTVVKRILRPLSQPFLGPNSFISTFS